MKYAGYPLDDRGSGRLQLAKPPVPGAAADTKTYTYAAGAVRIAETAAPPMKNRSWTLDATVVTDGAGTEGVIMAFGGVAAGITLYLDEGIPVFDYNLFEDHTILRGSEPLPEGKSTITLDFEYKGAKGEFGKGADLTLSVNGKNVAEASMESTVVTRFGLDTFGVGEDSGQPVTFEYNAPFRFTGQIDQVVIEVE